MTKSKPATGSRQPEIIGPGTRCSQATPAASVSLIFEPESISANVVTGAVDSGQAVLVGAIEPVDGLDVMVSM